MGENTSEASMTPKRPIIRPRTWSKFALPSERFSFETHSEILRQFVVRTKQGAEPIGAGAVEGGTVPKQAAALNVRFLTSLGLLREDEKANNKYVPTPTAIKFVSTRSVSDEKARPILRSVVEPSWFGEFTRNWFNTRPVTGEEEFVKELAIYSEVSDMSKKEQALKTIVAYLTYSGMVARGDDGSLTMGTVPGASPGQPGPFMTAAPAPKESRTGIEGATLESPADWHTMQTEDFYLKVRSDPEVLADLRAHLELLDRKIERLKAKRESSEE